MNLLSNISQNFLNLKNDFTGISFNLYGIYIFFMYLVIPISFIVIFYLIGRKIKLIFFKELNMALDIFVNIALGYIFVGSGVLVLGMLGLVYRLAIYAYLIIVIAIALYPFTTLINRLSFVLVIFKEYSKQFQQRKWINIAILGFVLISFLRLILPETGVDALWYHTDYPETYIESHSMMNVDPKGKYYPAVVPALSDMLYIFTTSISMKTSSRFIHFAFFILTILVYLTVFRKRYPFVPFAVLLFVTTPIIIQIAPSAYAEFPWIFCWIMAVFLITAKRKYTTRQTILPAILIGATLATKLWMMPFYGVFVIYLFVINIKEDKIKLLKLLLTFTVISFSIPLLWYLRAYLLTGNPLFPTFWTYPNGEFNSPVHLDLDLASLKSRVMSMLNTSPFSIIGFVSLMIYFLKMKKNKLTNNLFFVFAIILTMTQMLINYNFNRFVMPFYSIIIFFLGFGVIKFINFNRYFKYSFFISLIGLFLYYFINTLLILPYGLGMANQNKYLTRILSRDNSSYYDYDNQFSKLISDKDIVATYGLWGFYYANFKHIYAEDIFRKGERSLRSLEKRGANKLLLLGFDIESICKIEKLTDCYLNRYKLLTYYKFPTTNSAQYLYQLNKYVE